MSDAALLDQIIARAKRKPKDLQQELIEKALKVTKDMPWVPNPGPQRAAFDSLADETAYGGEAGGGKSSLIVGLSLTKHRRSLLLRRTNKEAEKFVDEYEQILGHRNGWNGQKQTWTLPGKVIDRTSVV